MKKTVRIMQMTLITLITSILCMYHTPMAAELSLFSPFDNQHSGTQNAPPPYDTAARAIDGFDLERPERSDTAPLTRDDAIGLFTDTPVAGDDGQGRIARLMALKKIYELGTDPVFDTNWEGFADRIAGPDIWKDSFSNTPPGMSIEDTLTLLSTESREIRTMLARGMAERGNNLQANGSGKAANRSAYAHTGNYLAPNNETPPEPEDEYRTERSRASDEEDGLFFGFNLDTTTMILLGVGILIFGVVCKRLPY